MGDHQTGIVTLTGVQAASSESMYSVDCLVAVKMKAHTQKI